MLYAVCVDCLYIFDGNKVKWEDLKEKRWKQLVDDRKTKADLKSVRSRASEC